MFEIDIKHNLDEIIRTLPARAKSQIPFASALALTKTAQDVQSEVKRTIPEHFTLRRPWIQTGIRVTPATKTNQTASVFSKDPFMGLQERGGDNVPLHKRVFEYGEYLAIPLDARRTKTDVVDKRDWPKNLINPFILTAKDGRQYLAVTQLRTGRERIRDVAKIKKQRTYSGTKLMYTLVRRDQLRPRLGLVATAQRLVPLRFGQNFDSAMRQAQASAR